MKYKTKVFDSENPIAEVPDEILDGNLVLFDSVVGDYHGDDFVSISNSKKKCSYEESPTFHDLK